MLERLMTNYRMIRYGLPLARLKPSSPLTIADKIEEQASRRGDHPFIVFEDRRVSYREANEDANQVAHWATSIGMASGDVIALLMLNRPEYISTWGGISKIGATTALINTNLTGRALAHAIDAAKTRKIIVGSECLENIATLDPDVRAGLTVYVRIDPADPSPEIPEGAQDIGAALASMSRENPDKSVRAGATAGDAHVYIYTSGTTGLPKAAVMSHLKFLLTGSAALISGLNRSDVMYIALPLYHSAGGAMATMSAINAGATIALRRRFSASEFWEDVDLFGVTAFQYIGEFCRYLLNAKPHAKESSHRVKFAIGNGLRPEIWEEFQSRFAIPKIVEFYGATEGNTAIVNFDGKVGAVGKVPPIVPAPLIIKYDVENDEHPRDDQGICFPCADGEVGELVAEIPQSADTASGRFEGYTSKEATEKKILRDVLKSGDTFFRSGDLLKRDAQGYYYFVDRIGDTFRWKGENVSTQEVAESISAFPGVQMINVYGVDVPGADGRAGMASIGLESASSFDGAALFAHIADTLPAYAAPIFVRLQTDFEVTGTFKLRKVDLQKEGYDPGAVKDPLYLRDDQGKTYVPLTPEKYAEVQAGSIRI
ncbi:MAG: long-chain-acyl-CoA synthetase [bacterium]|nr:long-chain-acyl-CoA synthetase [bacterium]